MEETDRPADLGQCFVAINPQCFAPGFEDRMSSLMDYLRNMQPVSHSTVILNNTGNLNNVLHWRYVFTSSAVLEA